jgi:FkbM family methyltransferase
MIRDTIRRVLNRAGLLPFAQLNWRRRVFELAKKNRIVVHIGRSVIEVVKDSKHLRISTKQSIYLEDMINHFSQYHEIVAPTVEGSREVVDYSKPALHTFRATRLKFWVPSIPEEEAALQSYFRWYTPKPGDIALDGGANCGVSTYYLSRYVGAEGRVLALEPDEDNWKFLLRNIELHQLTNVVPIKKALAGRTGTREFHQEGCLGSGFTDLVSRPEGTTNITMVETTTLADLIREYQLPRIDFVKLDIEGGEIEVLQSSKELLRKMKIEFAIDTNHAIQGELTHKCLDELFREIGYEVESRSDLTGFMTTWARSA